MFSLLVREARQLTPIDLLYEQVCLVVRERASGQGATEAIAGLLVMVEPMKDDAFYLELQAIPVDLEADATVWATLIAVFHLLDRLKLWTMRMVVRQGEEFIQGM